MNDELPAINASQAWKRILFRFFFIYFIFYLSPWNWLGFIPGVDFILRHYNDLIEWLVIKANSNFFHVFGIRTVKPVSNGSGDTSFNWAENIFYISIAVGGCIGWSIIDRRRKSYRQLNYLLCLLVRYTLALTAFGYGFDKIFSLQMPYPQTSQFATTLGDLLPMRLSWLFIGSSTPYQIFSGAMEVLAGVLLLWRRTATFGVLVATAVFTNVMMLNLCYDIPVKLFAMNLVLMCLYLVANECHRIACFFIFNKPAAVCSVYHYPLTKKWMRITRIVLKLLMVFLVGKDIYEIPKMYKTMMMTAEVKPVKSGIYDVVTFAVNKDTLPPLLTDTTRWRDVIFDKGGKGSIATSDSTFRQRYGRAYFYFTSDTIRHILYIHKNPKDSLVFNYQIPDSNSLYLRGKNVNDSLYVELRKSKRHFPLAENQFHWLSEANR